METYEDDDDTHFCIKCHVTVHGLENYVRHRQSGCRPPDDKNEVTNESPSTPTTVSYPEILNADAFFSSLELQSSSKSIPRQRTTLLENARKLKKNERRKKNSKSQVDNEEPSTSKEKLHSMLPAVADLEDPTEHLCIPSLVGFPDIVTSSTSKPSSTVTSSKLNQPISHGNSTKHEPENSLEGLITDSKQTNERKRQDESQRMEQEHQTWLEDTILADLVENNENKELSRYEFEYQHDEDSEDDILDEDLAEDDSYSESDDGEGRERPPRGHTGGKWKPELDDLPQDMPQLQEDDVDPEDEQHEHPPPTYTGGKWTPRTPETTQKPEDYEGKDSSGQPPPGHTRGKWVPGARADIGSGYWCNPCGRKLASRLMYNRHLLSDLHAKRSMREIDGVIHLSRGTDAYATRKLSIRRQAALAAKIKGVGEKNTKKMLRKREKEFLTCEMCYARVRRPQMGKHLLSHYHCRVAGVYPCCPRTRRFLLDNMANVVRQCPFQCSSCRFYCNTEETFLLHWRSALHIKTLEQISGSYRCAPCDFWCDNNDTMESHLLSTSHRDVVSMMNGSVPVVISKQRALPCAGCERQFRYNLQLRLHAKETGHEPSVTATDDYQQRITCNLCPQVVRSLMALQRHQLACHVAKKEKDELAAAEDAMPYFCSFCSMNFATPREAVLHRRTSSHKEIVRARKSSEETARTITRQCIHCSEKQNNLAEHKKHLLRVHPEVCHRCPKCGILFALSQDVTKHTKRNDCRGEKLSSVKTIDIKEEWKCDSCAFSTNSQSEYIFHEALHAGIIEPDKNEPGCSKLQSKYRCPVCNKIFTKMSLRDHIRCHTGERPFPCAKCSVSFARRSDLNAHQRMCLSPTSSGWLDANGRRRNFICLECNDGFFTKHALRQHMLRHAGKQYKCGLPGCPTVLRSASELKNHRLIVHDQSTSSRRYPCVDCSYVAKTKTQLRKHRARHENSTEITEAKYHSCPYQGCNFKTKIGSHIRRHMRLHTGTKPYKCRHCSYASNTVENLRKHVLSTNLHPGKTIYECDFCDTKNTEQFCTNFAKTLRAHLLESHPDKFPMPVHATNYVFRIFGREQLLQPIDTDC